jgi:hypothetical protein
VVSNNSFIAKRKYSKIIIISQEIVDRTEERTRISAMVNLNPTYSLRQISLAVGLCKSRIRNILRKYKYHPYKAQCHQQFLLLTKKVGVHSVTKCKSVLIMIVAFCRQFASQTNVLLH